MTAGTRPYSSVYADRSKTWCYWTRPYVRCSAHVRGMIEAAHPHTRAPVAIQVDLAEPMAELRIYHHWHLQQAS